MKPDPAAARARAAILREEAQALAEPARGMLLARAEFLEMFAEELQRGLHKGRGRVYSVDDVMTDAHRAALGTSRPGHAAKFRAWIANADGKRPHRAFSLRALAQEARTSPSALSQAQRPKEDPLARPIRPDVARAVERLTGWPADAAHWPAGIQDE